jgi:hypothetical protein
MAIQASGKASADAPPPDGEYEELNRLVQLYRHASLNQRYYGCRAEGYERLAWWLEMSSAVASALALGILLLFDQPPAADTARKWAAALAGIATLLMAIAPITQWSRKAKKFSQLHASYGQLFSDIGSVISSIRRDGCSAECIGASKLVHEASRRLHALDELEPDSELIEREAKKVAEAIPNDYVWRNF